ncbi:MAG: hypothetical protein GX774_10755 [Armatimonadetes bacterium]|nr:hypothetical protein [Armatimonadota bacterium]
MAVECTLTEQVEGCLVGAIAGALLGFARCVEPARFDGIDAAGMLNATLTPALDWQPEPYRQNLRDAVPLVDAGVQAYLTQGSRATPEAFAAIFRDHEGIATPAFQWDGLHTIQEILKEGMPPRLSGFGAFPSGLVCAAMPAVGAYHFAHPEYAYLDGVELASVAQPPLGADWAGLCAAAIAAAFVPGATGETVTDAVLKVALRNCREVFYDLEWGLRRYAGLPEPAFLEEWRRRGGAPDLDHRTLWIVYNPIAAVLPALRRYADSPAKLMALLVVPPPFMYTPTVSAAIGGAIAGAMHGVAGLPPEWREWAAPAVASWRNLTDVVLARARQEAAVVQVTERLVQEDAGGHSLLEEKVRGCILAGAIGNAMGSPVEGRTYQEVDRDYPQGVTTVLDPARLEGEDDNQMAMLLVETYLERQGLPVMARHFGKTWKDRLNRNHFYPFCMGHSYDLITQGWDPRIVGQWSVVTGSTVMCLEPAGIYHLADPEFAAVDATAIAYMYQRGLDVQAAAMLAATVAEALRPDATVDSVCQAALAAAPTEEFRTFDRRRFANCREYLEACLEVADGYDDVMAARVGLYEKCLLYHYIDPLELWGLALAMFRVARGDVRQAAIGGTNIGRDADTIAGRAAMLSGALRGERNVPPEWVALFSEEARARIHRNAARLASLVAEAKLPALKTRAALAAASEQ